MFGFIKKMFVVTTTFPVSSVNSLECVSGNNQECKIRTEIIDVNTNEPINYPYSIKINRCKGSCNKINDPYAKTCVLDNIKNTNVKVFNLMPRTNETRHIKWHKTCKCRCRLDASVCNNKQRWNEDKCICECKELIDKRIYDKGFIWNLSNCECECDKSCDIAEYLDYENCKCRKRIIDKLVEECTEDIYENETLDIILLNVIPLNLYKKLCNSCMVYIVSFVLFLITSMCICSVFIYFHWYLKKDNITINFSFGYLNISMAITKQMNMKNRTYYFIMT